MGIYCYQPDGTPTFVRAALGTLTLAGPPGPAPDTVPLAGPVVAGEPLGQQAEQVSPSPGHVLTLLGVTGALDHIYGGRSNRPNPP